VSDYKQHQIAIANVVHEAWDLWSRIRPINGKPCSKLQMLCSRSLREQFVKSVFCLVGAEYDSQLQVEIATKRMLEDLVGLDRGATILTSDDIDTVVQLSPHAAEVVELATQDIRELSS
jgi:hypothetical protein